MITTFFILPVLLLLITLSYRWKYGARDISFYLVEVPGERGVAVLASYRNFFCLKVEGYLTHQYVTVWNHCKDDLSWSFHDDTPKKTWDREWAVEYIQSELIPNFVHRRYKIPLKRELVNERRSLVQVESERHQLTERMIEAKNAGNTYDEERAFRDLLRVIEKEKA